MNGYKEADLLNALRGLPMATPLLLTLTLTYVQPGTGLSAGAMSFLMLKATTSRGRRIRKRPYRIYPNGITMSAAEIILDDDTRRFAVYVADKVKVLRINFPVL